MSPLRHVLGWSAVAALLVGFFAGSLAAGLLWAFPAFVFLGACGVLAWGALRAMLRP